MRALILNSGMGKRMGLLTRQQPKCMTELRDGETILSRQIEILHEAGIDEIVVTTGFMGDKLKQYCQSLGRNVSYIFVPNTLYAETNYIYSIYLARDYLQDDILMLHGDLVFEKSVLSDLLTSESSCMTISTVLPLSRKDFKAVVENGVVRKVGVEFYNNAYAAQPFYKLNRADWSVWLEQIVYYCDSRQVFVYAENALNDVTDRCLIKPIDVKNRLCAEVDDPDDLGRVRERIVKEAN
jgi:choline kinase